MEHIICKVEDDLLTCPICFDLAFSGKSDFQSLPCHHQVCDVCIKNMQARKKRNKSLECPVCRKKFDVKAGQTLPTFLQTKQLSNLIASFREELALTEHQDITVGDVQQMKQGNTNTQLYSPIGQYNLNEDITGVKTCIAASNSKLYFHTSDITGIFYLHLHDNGTMGKFGHQKSKYSASMVYNEGKLYVYNTTKKQIEEYANEKLVTSWNPEFPELDILLPCRTTQESVSLQPFPNGVLFSISLHLCDGSKKDVYKIYKERDRLEVLTMCSTSTKERQFNLIGRYLYRNRVLCIYRDSLWFVDCRDKHLMELPFKYVHCRCVVHIKEPIRHFKIPHFILGCGFKDKIIYTTEKTKVIHQLDLSKLPSLDNLKIKNNRVLYRQPKVLDPTVLLQLPADSSLGSLLASDEGNLVTLDSKDLIEVYQNLNQAGPVRRVAMVNEPLPEPDNPVNEQITELSPTQHILRLLKLYIAPFIWLFKLFRYCLLPIEILLFIMLMNMLFGYVNHYLMDSPDPYERISDNLAHMCVNWPNAVMPASLGFKYFHVSFCHESAHSEPSSFCLFPNWTTPSGYNVNMISNDAKCYENPALTKGLQTVLMTLYDGRQRMLLRDVTITEMEDN